jgi:nitrogen regulatory protein PII
MEDRNMKLVRAYVRTSKVDEVLAALKRLKAPRITVINVRALGDEISDEQFSDQLALQIGFGKLYTTMAKIELICNDESAGTIKAAIIEKARTGYRGDGLIAVSSIEEAISIRTGKKAIKG